MTDTQARNALRVVLDTPKEVTMTTDRDKLLEARAAIDTALDRVRESRSIDTMERYRINDLLLSAERAIIRNMPQTHEPEKP